MLLFRPIDATATILLLCVITKSKAWLLKGRNDGARLGIISAGTDGKEAVTRELSDLLVQIEQRHSPPSESNEPTFAQGITTPSCFFLALSTLPQDSSTPCETLSRSDNHRVQVAARMAICELETIGSAASSRERGRVPTECEDWIKGRRGTDVGLCVEALSRSPQYWSSYSGYLREVVVLCSSYRRWADLETARNLHASTSTTFADFLSSLKEYEKLRTHRERHSIATQTALSDHLSSLSAELSILRDALSNNHSSHTQDLERTKESLLVALERFESALAEKVSDAVGSIVRGAEVGMRGVHEAAAVEMREVGLQHSKDLSTSTVDLRSTLNAISQQLSYSFDGVLGSLIDLEEKLERNTALVGRNTEAIDSIIIASHSVTTSLDASSREIDSQKEEVIQRTAEHERQILALRGLIDALEKRNETFLSDRNWDWWWIISAFTGIERGGFGIRGFAWGILTFLLGREYSVFRVLISISAGFLVVSILWRILSLGFRIRRNEPPPKYTSQAEQFQHFLESRQKHFSPQPPTAQLENARRTIEDHSSSTRIRRASRIPERWLR